ncbi:hypothetical protein J5N97_011195 [Dioscorea zingiberensis]|uniref:Late embryogenesis abundant protein n=1 Tax=Dioscorea zingiberensis TaxID=325984 RepID=A0A9D5CZW6_9LILI|nr:hypothetical protein J5N97_011195 [Dioscorea zingiberensis]
MRIPGLRSARACFSVPPNSSQFDRSTTSSKVERDFGDVVTDGKERPSEYYSVERAAKMAARDQAKETAETFREKTRRTVEEAWGAAKDTTQEIKEGAKRTLDRDEDHSKRITDN